MRESLLLFRLGARLLAVPADLSRQVLALDHVAPLPGSEGALLGLTMATGRAVPVADLRTLLGMPAGEPSTRLLLLHIQEQDLALPIDDVLGFIEADQTPGNELLSPEMMLGGYSEGQRGQLLNPDLLLGQITQRLSSL